MQPMTASRTPEWINRRSLALAERIAAKLRRDPGRLEVARSNLARWKQTMDPWPAALAEWERELDRGVEAVIAVLCSPSDRGRRLRQSHPFAGLLDPREREQILRQYETG